MEAPPKSQSQEFFDTTLSSLASVSDLQLMTHKMCSFTTTNLFQGWSLFSSTATKVAETAKEKAFEISNIASQKVCNFHFFYSFGSLIISVPFRSVAFILIIISLKVREGTLMEEVGSQVTTLASKVRLVFLLLFFPLSPSFADFS